MFKNLIVKSASKSPWLYHVNTGSCNGCDIELVACLTPRYDVERFGFKLAGSPRHADIVVVSGPITSQSKDRLLRTLEQVPEPRCIVTIGSCPQSGNVFKGSYSVEAPLEQFVHVDVAIAGCTPKPEAIIEGLYHATKLLAQKRKAMYEAEKAADKAASRAKASEEDLPKEEALPSEEAAPEKEAAPAAEAAPEKEAAPEQEGPAEEAGAQKEETNE